MQRILELQRQLKEVQKIKPNSECRLNERNIVDIVQKLISQGRVCLIHTEDGKQYLTPDRIANEIEEIVAQNMGRMSLLDISSFIGVGIEVVEPAVMDLCALGKGKLINSSFITPKFIDNFIEELA